MNVTDTPFTWTCQPGWNPGSIRVNTFTCKYGSESNPGRTQVNTLGSTLVASRVEPSYEGVEVTKETLHRHLHAWWNDRCGNEGGCKYQTHTVLGTAHQPLLSVLMPAPHGSTPTPTPGAPQTLQRFAASEQPPHPSSLEAAPTQMTGIAARSVWWLGYRIGEGGEERGGEEGVREGQIKARAEMV